jgi:hypothetical protein
VHAYGFGDTETGYWQANFQELIVLTDYRLQATLIPARNHFQMSLVLYLAWLIAC